MDSQQKVIKYRFDENKVKDFCAFVACLVILKSQDGEIKTKLNFMQKLS